MKLKKIAIAAAATATMAAGAASAATLTFSPSTGVAVAWGSGNYNAGPCAATPTKCYDPTGTAAGLALDLHTFDSSNPGPGLHLDKAATLTVTFLGKEAGATNVAFSLGGDVSNNDLVGTSYKVSVGAGALDFAFKSSLGTVASNDGNFVDTATRRSAMGFSDIFTDGTTSYVYAYFDDSGAGLDRDYDDMVVKITVSSVPVPAAGFLLIAGLGGLAALKRRKKA
ncbi:VPLPA-CTERM sorting domain-containing protein [Seohaeicola zhoushanensis]|uniref:VPLPA-CTERM protein sorting domain-containing protein n=1 Tax=Seohaeicola zhoushanensis TaxID=1569283 RepID=A0A8J3H293_9RHOB|nr:VPLPA-CTERM sorting domain-containing protein [Seohaeicola zhoushanensis]GHF74897.1 hypothetical protein GCM10017056_51840 [Seohaeicola zhoushanensis]